MVRLVKSKLLSALLTSDPKPKYSIQYSFWTQQYNIDNSVFFWNSETCDSDFAWLTISLIPQELFSNCRISNRRKTKIVLKLSRFVILVSIHRSNQANPPTATRYSWNLRKNQNFAFILCLSITQCQPLSLNINQSSVMATVGYLLDNVAIVKQVAAGSPKRT